MVVVESSIGEVMRFDHGTQRQSRECKRSNTKHIKSDSGILYVWTDYKSETQTQREIIEAYNKYSPCLDSEFIHFFFSIFAAGHLNNLLANCSAI